MVTTQRITLTERDTVEGGVRCPGCGHYAAFGDIIATGGCSNGTWRGGECDATMRIQLVVDRG